MGLNRTPTAIFKAEALLSARKRKEARAGNLSLRELGSPPKTFTDEHKKLWREFAKIVRPASLRMRTGGLWKSLSLRWRSSRAGSISETETGHLTSLLRHWPHPPTAAGSSRRLRDEWSDLDEP